MTETAAAPMRQPWLSRGLGRLGRRTFGLLRWLRAGLEHVSGVARVLGLGAWYATVEPWRRRMRLREQLSPLLRAVGVKSLPIVALVNLLTGAVLVLQMGDVMLRYGQIERTPGVVALAMTRELGPVMTAVVMTARVGASFTAVLASMKLNEEILALETMAIAPAGYLVAPRLVSMMVMGPCLTVFGFLLGILGGALPAIWVYDLSFAFYLDRSFEFLVQGDLLSGVVKALVFSVVIAGITCYYGLIAEGGPTGLGRHTMMAVVASLVSVVIADAILTSFSVNFLY